MALQHLRSSTANKRPIPTQLSAGQIAVNTNEASPGLFFKDSNGDLVKIGPVHVGTSAPNSSPASTAATALVSGTVYQILTVGTTDFTAIGASANTVGTVFTATGAGTGTGTVSGQQGNEKGEQWLDITGGAYDLKIYDGSAWRSQAGEFVNHTGDTMTGVLQFVSGSASAPGIAFSGDTNTGIYRPGADSVAVTTGGTQRITVDSSGRLLVGTTTPGLAAGDELTLAGSGNSGLTIRSGSTTSGSIYFSDGTAEIDQYKGLIQYTHSGDYMRFLTANTERLRIDSSGSVGIGTTANGSNAKFEVKSTTGSISSATSRINAGATTTGAINTGASLLFAGHDGANERDFASLFAGKENGTSGNHNAYLAFATRVNSGSLTERMRIDSSGNIGIGTSSPGVPLDIAANNSTANLRITDNTNGARIKLVAASAQFDLYNTGGAGYIGTPTNSDILIATNNTERMRISSSGLVGIGASNNTSYDSAAQNLLIADESGNTGITIRSGGSTPFGSIHFADGISSPDEKRAGRIMYGHSGDFFAFITANSERLRITSDGKVGIGTSSPDRPLAVSNTSGDGTLARFVGPTNNLFIDNDRSGIIDIFSTGTGDSLAFGTQDTERLRIDSSGRLLVGTNAADQDAPLTICRTGAGGVTPSTISGSTVATFRATGGLSHESHVSILGGSSGASQLNFGDRDDEDVANIRYDHSNNSMRFVTLNAERMRIDSSGRVGIGDSDPNFTLDVNGNVGIREDNSLTFHDGAGVAAFRIRGDSSNKLFFERASGNEHQMVIDDGKVGIGTTSPGGKLSVFDSSSAVFRLETPGVIAISHTFDGTNYTINNNDGSSGHPIIFGTKTAGAESMRIDSSGNVGIGTSSISSRLHVKGAADSYLTLQAGTTDGNDGVLFQNSGGTQKGALLYDTDDNYLLFNVNSAERIRIDSSGQVGIGTSSPVQQSGIGLHINNTTGQARLKLTSSSTGATANDGVDLIVETNNEVHLLNHEAAALKFGTSDSEKMRIDGTGRVGIGNTTMSSFTGNSSDNLVVGGGSGSEGITVYSAAQGSLTFADGTSGNAAYRGAVEYNHTADQLAFRTAGTGNRMVIDSSGRVGIGVTSINATRAVEINQPSGYVAGLRIRNSGSGAYNQFFSNVSNWRVGSPHNTNALVFDEGNTSSERMRIDSSGNVGIGDSSPDTTLHIDSTGATTTLKISSNTESSVEFDDKGGSPKRYKIGTNISSNDGQLEFKDMTANVERMRIDSSGTVYINNTTVNSTNYGTRIGGSSTTAGFLHTSRNVGTGSVVLQAEGQSGAFLVRGDGDCENTNNRYTGISDVKLKENIVDASSQWDDIKALQVRNYNFKEETGYSTHTQIGLVAQEVEAVCPGLVAETNDTDDDLNKTGTTTKSVAYSILYMKSVKALQEAMARIETLEAKVAALEAG